LISNINAPCEDNNINSNINWCLLMRNRKYGSIVVLRYVPTIFNWVNPRVKILLYYYARKLLFFVNLLNYCYKYDYENFNVINIIISSLFDDNLTYLRYTNVLQKNGFCAIKHNFMLSKKVEFSSDKKTTFKI